MLRHSVPHFSPIVLKALRVWWRNSTPRFAWLPERRNVNIHLNKYFISSSGDRAHNQSIFEILYTYTLCAPPPRLASMSIYGLYTIIQYLHIRYKICKITNSSYPVISVALAVKRKTIFLFCGYFGKFSFNSVLYYSRNFVPNFSFLGQVVLGMSC